MRPWRVRLLRVCVGGVTLNAACSSYVSLRRSMSAARISATVSASACASIQWKPASSRSGRRRLRSTSRLRRNPRHVPRRNSPPVVAPRQTARLRRVAHGRPPCLRRMRRKSAFIVERLLAVTRRYQPLPAVTAAARLLQNRGREGGSAARDGAAGARADRGAAGARGGRAAGRA